jgi:hypothetical protein
VPVRGGPIIKVDHRRGLSSQYLLAAIMQRFYLFVASAEPRQLAAAPFGRIGAGIASASTVHLTSPARRSPGFLG